MLSAVIAVLISQRTDDAPKFQEVLTKHGCIIRTRLGLHEVDNCREDGLIILHVSGTDEDVTCLAADINALKNIRAKVMKLDF
ncbi:MAG: hypothetical protein KGZ66_10755 [Selenomonadales bacterium]|nr:hypothetical protein [Selenomonadales bacterium]